MGNAIAQVAPATTVAAEAILTTLCNFASAQTFFVADLVLSQTLPKNAANFILESPFGIL